MGLLLLPAPAAIALLALTLACEGASPGHGRAARKHPGDAPVSLSDGAGTRALAFEHLVSGVTSCLRPERGERVLTDPEAWREWHAGVACRGGEPPPVAFGSAFVLAVDGEDGTNACHAVRIDSVTEWAEGIRVAVTRYVPGEGRRCAQIVVRPYHAVVVATTAGLPSSVRFEWRTVTGAPPR